jgi:hypothetical protein
VTGALFLVSFAAMVGEHTFLVHHHRTKSTTGIGFQRRYGPFWCVFRSLSRQRSAP